MPTTHLIKYPRTAHLFDAGGTATTTDDLVLPDLKAAASVFCDGQTRVVIEEKVDGANLGISIDVETQEILVQNRSHFVSGGNEGGSSHAQFNRIYEWTARHGAALYELLGKGDLILYGEWLVAKHSIPYHKLPDVFVAFDLFDRNQQKFFSRSRFHAALQGTNIPVVPVIWSGVFEKQAVGSFRRSLLRWLDSQSAFRTDNGTVEGIVLRIDTPNDDDQSLNTSTSSNREDLWLLHKYKVVRPDFIRGCNDGHWFKRKIEKQRVDFEFQGTYLKECYCFARNNIV